MPNLRISELPNTDDPVGLSIPGERAGANYSFDIGSFQLDLDELDSGKQPINSDLTDIAGLSASDGDLLYREGGSWVNKTTSNIKNILLINRIYGNNNIAETVTGTTSPVILTYNVPINPNDDLFGANDDFEILIRRTTNSSTNQKLLEAYIGPTPGSLTGATKIILHNNATSGATSAATRRTMGFYNSLTVLRGLSLGITASATDDLVGAGWSSFSVPTFASGNPIQYFIFVFTNVNSGDSQTLDSVKIIHHKK